MERKSKWEKSLDAEGRVITWEHDEIVDYLLDIYNRDKDELLLKAAQDETKRWQLCFVLDYPNCFSIGQTNFGGLVMYNKKKRRFTHIVYSDRHNYGVTFSITSKASFFAYDFYKAYRKIWPRYFPSTKKFIEYLLKH